ncbi:hypothetical protein Tco_0675371 [Tanacetum coccineum]
MALDTTCCTITTTNPKFDRRKLDRELYRAQVADMRDYKENSDVYLIKKMLKQNQIRNYRRDCVLLSVEKQKNEMLVLEKEKLSNESKDIQATMEQQIKILENDFKRAEAQYVNLDLKMQHQKEKMACDVSWKSKMTKLSDENTYAYGDVRAKNQDLLMIISELKAKLAEQEKNVNTKFDKSRTLEKPVYVTPLNKNKDLKAKIVSKVEIKTDKSKPVSSLASSNSVSISESKDTNSKKRVLLNTKSKITSKDVKKSQSSFTSVANKNDTMNSNGKRALFTSPVAAKSSKLRATPVVAKSRFSVAPPPKATNMVSSASPLTLESRQIRFGNDNFAAITGYGDYDQGNLTICHVYYVEGLRHSLFSIGQFCDGDLEVAFRSNTCFIRNLEGEDLLTGSRESNLYTISISEMAASSPGLLVVRDRVEFKSFLQTQTEYLEGNSLNDCSLSDLDTLKVINT